jgi:hypothetical protein
LFRYVDGTEHSPESMRKGAEPPSQTHTLIAKILPQIGAHELQTVFFQCTKDGPETLLVPIETEFSPRGISPYAPCPTEFGLAGIITAERISELIANAPAWALIGLTMPQERLREDARREVAEHVYSALFQPSSVETEQLRLPL